ncbi:MAG: translation initiation factor IF-3 C-terminal domain-containing protein, partial [Actinobacteria bacterium]|nr:translation initiation factor IF-3 C-terminal domain-containing protein [Actinomycetota bacterium]
RMRHPELGKKILDRVAEQLDGVARVETEPRLDGRNMVMVLAPEKKVRVSHSEGHANASSGDIKTAVQGHRAPEHPEAEGSK